MSFRLIFKILIVFSAIFLPFWVTFLMFVFSSIYFDEFYFGLLAMLIVNIVYGFETIPLLGIPGALFFLSVLIYFSVNFIKKFLILRRA